MQPEFIIMTLALAGLAFSGYLAAHRFFAKTCALGEPCPIFLGRPACYWGFALYLALAILSLILVRSVTPPVPTLQWIAVIAGAGVLFAGYVTAREVPLILRTGLHRFTLPLPTCTYGFIVFFAILATALRTLLH